MKRFLIILLVILSIGGAIVVPEFMMNPKDSVMPAEISAYIHEEYDNAKVTVDELKKEFNENIGFMKIGAGIVAQEAMYQMDELWTSVKESEFVQNISRKINEYTQGKTPQ